MKKLIPLLYFLLFTATAFSQDVLELIAIQTCECLEDIPDTLDLDAFNMQLGLCMIEAAMPYEKELRKEYKIRLENIDRDGEQLGRMVGIKLVSVCPEGLQKISRMQPKEEEEYEIEAPVLSVMGDVVSVDDSGFVVFSIKESSGKISKFYWLTLISSDDELIYNYQDLLGRVVNVTYEQMDFFDPKIKEYRSYNIIHELIVMEEL